MLVQQLEDESMITVKPDVLHGNLANFRRNIGNLIDNLSGASRNPRSMTWALFIWSRVAELTFHLFL